MKTGMTPCCARKDAKVGTIVGAQVSNVRYASLSASDQPFLCPSCVAEQQAHVVQELQSMVRCLAEEVHELKATVAVLQSSNSTFIRAPDLERELPATCNGALLCLGTNAPLFTCTSSRYKSLDLKKGLLILTWQGIIKVRRSKGGIVLKPCLWHLQSTARPMFSSPNTQPCDRSTGPRQDTRQVVDGVRRVWGTMRSCTPKTLLSTLQRVTTVAEHVEVRRKFKVKGNTEIRWWFLILGEEHHGDWNGVINPPTHLYLPMLQVKPHPKSRIS